MRYLTLLIALLVAFPAFAKIECKPQNPDVVKAVQALTPERSYDELDDSLDVIAAHPQESACLLVGELKVVRARIIRTWEEDKYTTALHVVWALRGLRKITGCQDFRAATTERFVIKFGKTLPEARAEFLSRRGPGNTPFFAVWMSRNMVFLAASDPQAAIIKKWQSWLSHSEGFVFTPCEDMNDWYF